MYPKSTYLAAAAVWDIVYNLALEDEELASKIATKVVEELYAERAHESTMRDFPGDNQASHLAFCTLIKANIDDAVATPLNEFEVFNMDEEPLDPRHPHPLKLLFQLGPNRDWVEVKFWIDNRGLLLSLEAFKPDTGETSPRYLFELVYQENGKIRTLHNHYEYVTAPSGFEAWLSRTLVAIEEIGNEYELLQPGDIDSQRNFFL